MSYFFDYSWILCPFIGVYTFEDVDTPSSLYRLASEGKTFHQSFLGGQSGDVHGWACCFCPWVAWYWCGSKYWEGGSQLVTGPLWDPEFVGTCWNLGLQMFFGNLIAREPIRCVGSHLVLGCWELSLREPTGSLVPQELPEATVAGRC